MPDTQQAAVTRTEAASVPRTPSPAGDPGGRRLGDLAQRYALLVAWLVVIVVFGIAIPDTFLSGANFASMFGSQAVIVVLTLGLIVPLTAGDYDLSIAFNLTFSAMVLAVLNAEHGWPILPAVLVALACGVTMGLANGLIITYFGIDSIIVTLGTGTFVGGLVLWISDSNTISGVSNTLVDAVVGTRVLGVPVEFYYGIALCVTIWYVFEFTPLGRRLLIVGRSRSVARLSGLRVQRIRIGALVTSGFISALAGVLYAGTTGAADPSSGTQLLLPSFAAAFLGATAIMPGRFNPWGSVIAVYFLVTGITGLQLLGVASFVQNLFYGGILVVAVALSQLARRRQALEVGAS